LLKGSSGANMTRIPINLPIKQHFEESQVVETWLKIQDTNVSSDRKIIETSIVKKGNNRAFTYT
jgi:hypothetical protein